MLETNSILVNFASGFGGGNITVTASNACGSVNGSLAVTGAPTPPTISGSTSVCAGDAENYIANSPDANGFVWTVKGNVIPTGNANEIIVEWITNGGTVSVVASNSCGTAASVSLTVGSSCRLSGNSVMADALQAAVFPNPSKGQITLQYNSPEKTDYLMKVTDLTGRVIYSETLKGTEGMNQHDLDLGNLAKGMYKLSIENAAGESIVMKVIIE